MYLYSQASQIILLSDICMFGSLHVSTLTLTYFKGLASRQSSSDQLLCIQSLIFQSLFFFKSVLKILIDGMISRRKQGWQSFKKRCEDLIAGLKLTTRSLFILLSHFEVTLSFLFSDVDKRKKKEQHKNRFLISRMILKQMQSSSIDKLEKHSYMSAQKQAAIILSKKQENGKTLLSEVFFSVRFNFFLI